MYVIPPSGWYLVVPPFLTHFVASGIFPLKGVTNPPPIPEVTFGGPVAGVLGECVVRVGGVVDRTGGVMVLVIQRMGPLAQGVSVNAPSVAASP